MPRRLPSSTSQKSLTAQKGLILQPDRANFVLKEKCGASLWWPKSEGKLVFRPLLPKDDDNPGNWSSYCYSDGGFPWIRRYNLVRGLGPKKLSFVVNDPENPSAEWSDDISKNKSPVWLLIYRIGLAIKEGAANPLWNYRTPFQRKRDSDPNALWLGLSDGFFVQSLIYQAGTTPRRDIYGLADTQMLPVIDMNSNTGLLFLDLVREKFPKGELLDFTKGQFVCLEKSATSDYNYDVSFAVDCGGRNAAIDIYSNSLWAKVQQWSNIIHLPTPLEQIELMFKAGVCASALVYALEEDYGTIIPNNIREAAEFEIKRYSHANTSISQPTMPTAPIPPAPQITPLSPSPVCPNSVAPDAPAWSEPDFPVFEDANDLNYPETSVTITPDVETPLSKADNDQTLEGQPAFTTQARIEKAKEMLSKIRTRKET